MQRGLEQLKSLPVRSLVNADSGRGRRKAVLLGIILLSYLMIILDTSIVLTGLPKIQAALHLSATHLSWIQSSYTLAFGGLLLLAARAGDIVGRKRMYLVGLGIFAVASLGVGAAQSAGWMLASRALQGVGAAILAPTTLALLQSNFAEGPERTRAVAYYGAVAGIGASVGLVLGGVLADWVSWRAGFFINLPIALVLALTAVRYVSETEKSGERFDLPGAVLSSTGMLSLVFGIVRAADVGWTDSGTIGAIAAGVALLVGFVANERRARQPIMPLSLFVSIDRSVAYATRMLFLGAMVGFFFFTTQYMQTVLGFSALQAGFGFLPMTLVNFAVALAVPRLTRRFGNMPLLASGLALTFIGMLWLSRVSAGSTYLYGVALPMVLIGIGQGCSLSPLTVAGMAGVSKRDAGAASGVTNVAHQLGLSLGLSVSVVAFATAGRGVGDPRLALASGVSAALTAGTIMLGIALAAVAALIVRNALAVGDHAGIAEKMAA